MAFEHSIVKKLIGKESAAVPALDKVSKSDIRHWCEAIDLDNTPFHKINWKKKNAPPAMMMVWTMLPLWSPEAREPTEPHELVTKALDDAGYDGAIGLSIDQEFLKPVYVGDRLSYKVKVTGVSSKEVTTKMGKGYQLDLAYTLSNQKGEVVSTHDYTLLKFKALKPPTKAR